MFSGLNRCEFIGRLASEPRFGFTANNRSVANLMLHVETLHGDHLRVERVSVVCWESLAEKCKELQRGALLFAAGRLCTNSWVKDGERRFKTEIVANTLIPLEQEGVMEQPESKRGFLASLLGRDKRE